MLAAATDWLFDPTGLTAHGFCLLWQPWLIWTYAGADAAIGMAYFSIPIALTIYSRRRRDAVMLPVIWLFASFILLCGIGHWIHLLTIWVPAYPLESLIGVATAIVSVITAAAIWLLMPQALALPSLQQLREVNDALRESEARVTSIERNHQRFGNMVEALPMALVLTGHTGQIETVNATAERLFGYTRTELTGRHLDTLLLESFAGEHAELRRDFLAHVSVWAMGGRRDLFGLRKDGSRFPLEIGLSSMDVDGEPMVLAGVNDITEQRESERALQRQQDALERSNGELIRARLRAEEATRAKSLFLAGMSHELRTPLNGILGYAQLLDIAGGLSETQASRVSAMRRAGEHLLHMINRVLDLSEIEAERVTLQAEMIDPQEVVRDCMNLVRPGADVRGLAMTLDVDPELPDQVMADQLRLRQILLNLLSNALKFTDQGMVEARLRVIRRVDGETALLIQIADTGRGVPAERRAELFKAFERLGADPDGTIEGAGLGLAISARLAGLMGGRIVHADNPGGGSVFGFELPFALAKPAEAPAAPGALPQPQLPVVTPLPPASAGTLRVLVVDDIAMNRDIAMSFLRAAGHAVTCADGGEAAVAAAAHADYDVVLMDLRMPEVDGFAAARRIGALHGSRGRVPIVALTAHAFAEHVEECRQAGMVGHLAKPFTQSALLAVIAAAVNDRTPEQPPGALADTLLEVAGLPVIDLDTFETTAAFLAPASVAAYLETIVADIEDIREALRAWQNSAAVAADDVVEATHKLAGAVGMFGFTRLTAVALRFEQATRLGAAELPAFADGLNAALEASSREARRRLNAARASASVTRPEALAEAAERAQIPM